MKIRIPEGFGAALNILLSIQCIPRRLADMKKEKSPLA